MADEDAENPLHDLIGVGEALLEKADPTSLGWSLLQALIAASRRPDLSATAILEFYGGFNQAVASTVGRAIGVKVPGPVAPDPKDRRFEDPTWSDNPTFYGLLQLYLLVDRMTTGAVAGAGLREPDASKARFGARLLLDALSPTNGVLTNPQVIKRAFETSGLSILRGIKNFVGDLVGNGGWPSQVDANAFRVGDNMAATTGRVVYRNDLIELLQYEPQTARVHEIPMLFCPPWINKYYIMDLAPGKSLIEWAVGKGLTSFAISYRNPDASMRDLSFDDYLLHGPRAALGAVLDITGAPQVNTLGVCLGGTLNAALLAYLNAKGEDLIRSASYLNTLTDFSQAGTLKDVFTDARTVESLAAKMETKGYLEASEMAHTFDLLRPRDLIFNYVVSNWLLGNKPPAFDLLAWNNDSTRMPARMHTYYLRKCWIDNALANDALVLDGEQLFLSKVPNDTYIVAAVDDHIVPWRASYQATKIFNGHCRFVLSSSGHIAGIVNPPGPKCRLWTNDDLPLDPDAWRASATEHKDTWWNDWISWVVARSGPLGPPPRTGSSNYPAGEAAPGSYVFG